MLDLFARLVKELFQLERDDVEGRSEALVIGRRERGQKMVRRRWSIRRGQLASGHHADMPFPRHVGGTFRKRLSRARLCPVQGEAGGRPLGKSKLRVAPLARANVKTRQTPVKDSRILNYY